MHPQVINPLVEMTHMPVWKGVTFEVLGKVKEYGLQGLTLNGIGLWNIGEGYIIQKISHHST